MAKKDRSALRAGLFIVISLLLIGVIVVGIKGMRTFFTPIEERQVRFALKDDVGGLRIGDDVRLGGFKVGVIRQIEVQGLQNDQLPGILITFSLPVLYPLHTNTHIAVQTGLTGSSCLNISDLGDGPLLAAGGQLAGGGDSLAQLKSSLADAGPRLTALLSDLRPQVSTFFGKADSALDRGGEALVQVRDLLGDTNPDIRGTMANLNLASRGLKNKLPDILSHVDLALVKISSTIDNARGTLEDIKTTMANARDLTGSARGVLVSNRGKLDGIISSLKSTSDNLKGASSEIRRSPWRILYKPGPGEVDNLELFDAARQFSDGANSMNDASLALRDCMKDPAVDRAKVQKLLDKLTETFSNFSEVEDKLWKAVKE